MVGRECHPNRTALCAAAIARCGRDGSYDQLKKKAPGFGQPRGFSNRPVEGEFHRISPERSVDWGRPIERGVPANAGWPDRMEIDIAPRPPDGGCQQKNATRRELRSTRGRDSNGRRRRCLETTIGSLGCNTPSLLALRHPHFFGALPRLPDAPLQRSR